MASLAAAVSQWDAIALRDVEVAQQHQQPVDDVVHELAGRLVQWADNKAALTSNSTMNRRHMPPIQLLYVTVTNACARHPPAHEMGDAT
jgi:hypothetical protein